MEAQNPYRTPAAAAATNVAKVGSRTLAETLFSFDGRIPRMTFWLYSIGAGFLFGVLMGIVGGVAGAVLGENGGTLVGLIVLVMYIPMIWISLALQIKRWHDRDKSGWWVLIGLVPIIGGIWAFIECGCLRGTVGPNQYGADPT